MFDTSGGEVHIGKLIITPIDQSITVENKEDIEEPLYLEGTDETGDKVDFFNFCHHDMWGSRINDDDTSYELNYDVKSYTLQFSYHDLETDELVYVGEPFTIDIP